MKKENDGGPAFPGVHPPHTGMSLRDYFAAMAPISVQDAVEWLDQNKTPGSIISWADIMEQLAKLRYRYADAMLKERE